MNLQKFAIFTIFHRSERKRDVAHLQCVLSVCELFIEHFRRYSLDTKADRQRNEQAENYILSF